MTTIPTNSPAPAATPASGAPATDPWLISSAALAFWLAIQIGCMSLALLHIPLAAEYTVTERHMPEVLLAGQIVSAAVLAPLLCRSLGTLLISAASAWPALILSGSLAMRPMSSSLLAATGVTVWMLILWLWSTSARNTSIRAVVSAIAALATAGMPLAIYFEKEFGNPDSPTNWFAATPLPTTWALSQGVSLSTSHIAIYAIITAAGLLLRIVAARRA